MTKILYEFIYEKNQKRKLGSDFVEFEYIDIANPKLREIVGFNKFCDLSAWKLSEYSGLFSPNFLTKLNLNANQVFDFINKNPGREIYLFHPYPYEIKIQNHFLSLAELEHPGITEALKSVWKYIFNEKLPNVQLLENENICCHCNYFVGSRTFWGGYSYFVKSFFNLLNSFEGKFLWNEVEYSLNPRNESTLPMAVFVFERALTHYIKSFMKIEQVINYSTSFEGKNSWEPKALFPNENIIVDDLIHSIEPGLTKDNATKVYYQYRKYWSSL